MYPSTGARAWLAGAFLFLAALPASAGGEPAKNLILMIADGIGFNGWMAADYYAGEAGKRPYQVVRPDGTAPVLVAQATWALNAVGHSGAWLDADGQAVAAVPQGYKDRFERFLAVQDRGPGNLPGHQFDLVAGIGDIPQKGTTVQYEAVTAVLSWLTRPLDPIMGNEEFGSTEQRFLRYTNRWSSDQPTIDSVRYVVEHDVVALVATPDRDGRDFTDAGLTWVEERLRTLAPKPVFLFTHGAPVGVFPAGGDKGIAHPGIARVLGHENLAAVFTGDLHMDIERIEPFRDIDGVTHVYVTALERTKLPDKTRHTPYFHVVSLMTDGEVLVETYRAGDDTDAAPRLSHRFDLTD